MTREVYWAENSATVRHRKASEPYFEDSDISFLSEGAQPLSMCYEGSSVSNEELTCENLRALSVNPANISDSIVN